MKCKIPNDCWVCFKYDNCEKFDDYKNKHPSAVMCVSLTIVIILVLYAFIYFVLKIVGLFL